MTATTSARISVASVFKAVGYSPHAAQIQVHASRARHRVLDAGRRLGKSEVGAGELDVEAIRTKFMVPMLEESGKRREFWIVGPEYTDSEKEFRKHYDAMRRIGAPFDKPGTYYDAHSGDMQLSMYGGKYLVIGKSAKHPERLVGEGLSGVIMAEAAKQKERTWIKYIRPTLADQQGWSIHSSTPEGKNWFYRAWQRGQDPNDESWESWRFGSWHNPFVYPMGASPGGLQMLREAINEGRPITATLKKNSGVDPEIIEFMLDLSEEAFNQEIGADFTEFVGRVFKEFDEEVHVGDFPFMSTWKTYAACDYGFTDPFVWLLIQEDLYGNVYVLDEIYETGLSIDDAARLISSRGLAPAGLIEFMPDPASPGDTLALERHLRVRGNRNTGGERNIRLRYIREALRDVNRHLPIDDPLRHPKLRIDRKCVNLIREMQEYRYPDRRPDLADRRTTAPKDEPLHANSHSPEALGRFYRGRYGDPARPQGGHAVVRRSNLSR
jgi:hypothetical protein